MLTYWKQKQKRIYAVVRVVGRFVLGGRYSVTRVFIYFEL